MLMPWLSTAVTSQMCGMTCTCVMSQTLCEVAQSGDGHPCTSLVQSRCHPDGTWLERPRSGLSPCTAETEICIFLRC